MLLQTYECRGELVGGVAPHSVLAFLELSHAWGIILAIAWDVDGLCGQEVACYLDLDSLGRKGQRSSAPTVLLLYPIECDWDNTSDGITISHASHGNLILIEGELDHSIRTGVFWLQ